MKHETRVILAALVGPLPAVALVMWLLWIGDLSRDLKITLTVLVMGGWLIGVAVARHRVVYPLRTLANMLGALREQDFSMRLRGADRDEAMGEVYFEANALGALLREQRLGAIEASTLLRQVMAEIGVAVFAFDTDYKLRLLNRHAERLLHKPADKVLGLRAQDLGLEDFLTGTTPRIVNKPFLGTGGRWELRRGTLYEGGVPQQVILLSDLTQTLRQEERQAWERLVHVLRHEVNNSLAPIQSLSESLTKILQQDPRRAGWEEDLREGLDVIAHRSSSLNRFMAGYTRLTRLPPPQLRSVKVADALRRAAALETRLPVTIEQRPEMTIQADSDQLGQLLINLMKNAVDAVLGAEGARVHATWQRTPGGTCEIRIEDNGPGIANPDNLFVPFYTTKQDGTGIGLVLSRQIAEAHGGSLRLENRSNPTGCVAICEFPHASGG